MKKVYIYGILGDNDEIIYVGKSTRPKGRLIDHRVDKDWDKCKILAIYEDLENFWIHKLLKEGHPLKNKEMLVEGEEWNVGDVITLNNKSSTRSVKVRHKQTGVIYESGYRASLDVYGTAKFFVSLMKKHPNSIYHKEWEFVDDL